MLIEYIEHLRRQPREVRERAVIRWTIVVVVVIALVYIGLQVFFATQTSDPVDRNTIAAPYESDSR